MTAMKTFLLRLPESMSHEIDQITEETYCTKSQFIRQSITRNLDIIRHVEIPAIREHYKQRIPKLY
jgi:Arc/MetJ-type ribon-helix-helix transcriptional regulator